jgi:HD-GYP domain-containing protein (c-di-GMP phosphodiesterase class II)
MSALRQKLRQLRLRDLVFLLLVLSGIIPLVTSNLLLMRQNREIFETQEKTGFTNSARALSREVGDYLDGSKRQLTQLGRALLAAPGPDALDEKLRQPWVGPYLESYLRSNPNLIGLRVLGLEGGGPSLVPQDATPAAVTELDTAFEQARSHGKPVYRFLINTARNQPLAVIAVPVGQASGATTLIVEAVAGLQVMEEVFREAGATGGVFLLDAEGKVLWSEGANPEMQRAVASSDLVRAFTDKPLNLVSQYSVQVGGIDRTMLGWVSPLQETGWAIVVHRPLEAAFRGARTMFINTLIASGVLLALALMFAAIAASLLGRPIQRLAQSSHDMAAGNFGRRVELGGPGVELINLAEDFNRMSGHVQGYVEQLRQAAALNRELFISSIRAFAAAIDAKDPYTRGHSERVAAMSRTVARHLGQNEDFQTKVWIGGVLHDVGKIGIEDRILKKGGVLTAEEYEQMKLHPTIGADIMAPIDQLREMIPGIRWHHEAWNGQGYPDKLKAEQIPLIARVIAVADCFDAITTNRPYQRAYTAEFAVETITKLAGSRFDARVVTAFLRAFEGGEIRAREEQTETAQAAVAGS